MQGRIVVSQACSPAGAIFDCYENKNSAAAGRAQRDATRGFRLWDRGGDVFHSISQLSEDLSRFSQYVESHRCSQSLSHSACTLLALCLHLSHSA